MYIHIYKPAYILWLCFIILLFFTSAIMNTTGRQPICRMKASVGWWHWLSDECVLTEWWVKGDWVMNVWWLGNECVVIEWWVRGDWVMSVWWLRIGWWVCGDWGLGDECVVTEWWVRGDWMMSVCRLSDECVLTEWWVCVDWVMSVWWLVIGWWVCGNWVMSVWWLVIGWWVCDDSVMSVWWLSGECVVIEWASDECMVTGDWVMSVGWVSDECMVTEWWVWVDWVISVWWLSGECVVTEWRECGDWVARVWWLGGECVMAVVCPHFPSVLSNIIMLTPLFQQTWLCSSHFIFSRRSKYKKVDGICRVSVYTLLTQLMCVSVHATDAAGVYQCTRYWRSWCVLGYTLLTQLVYTHCHRGEALGWQCASRCPSRNICNFFFWQD